MKKDETITKCAKCGTPIIVHNSRTHQRALCIRCEIEESRDRVYAKENWDADGNYVMPQSVRSGFAKMHNRMAAAYDRFGKKEDAAAARELAKKMGA